jgi:hypothetical protein
MKTKLLQLQKSTNDSTWGMGVELGAAGPGLTSTSPEEQRGSRIRVRLKTIRTGHLVQVSGHGRIHSRHKVQTRLW